MLLTVLGQKSLTGSCASDILESMLMLIAKLLTPLLAQQQQTFFSIQPAGRGHQ